MSTYEEGRKFWRQQLDTELKNTTFTIVEFLKESFTESDIDALQALPQREGPTSVQASSEHPKFLIIRGKFGMKEISNLLPNKKIKLSSVIGHNNPKLPFTYEIS